MFFTVMFTPVHKSLNIAVCFVNHCITIIDTQSVRNFDQSHNV